MHRPRVFRAHVRDGGARHRAGGARESSREAHHRVRREAQIGRRWGTRGVKVHARLVDEARAVETRTKRFDAIRDAMRAADRAMETRRARDSEADEAEARENANAAAARESRAAAPDAAPDAVRDAATSRAPWCLAADDGPAGRYLSAVAASVSRSPLLARPIAADASSLPPSSTALAAKLEGSRFASFYAANERGLARGLAAPPRTCRGPPPPRTKEETRVRRGTAVDDEALLVIHPHRRRFPSRARGVFRRRGRLEFVRRRATSRVEAEGDGVGSGQTREGGRAASRGHRTREKRLRLVRKPTGTPTRDAREFGGGDERAGGGEREGESPWMRRDRARRLPAFGDRRPGFARRGSSPTKVIVLD